ncbi:hypothetical protein B484DRAFT_445603 [Ochromonadaceae sp. CCMP2298]|nr:hypothetical protein B484DRAFT_445603 [Ochromonadaceae sp. CCMP2298]|mmetsp:Transcript_1036/g.2295  ORF Transcript_1036/g.2295 Transcript_1036/m.2295 type:complete len:431 (-) Transcript_1036:377-1669(-)
MDYMNEDQKKGEFDARAGLMQGYYNRDSTPGFDSSSQYQVQNGYNLGGFGGQNPIPGIHMVQQQQRQQQLLSQQMSLRGQNDNSILNLGSMNKPMNNFSMSPSMGLGYPPSRVMGSEVRGGGTFDHSNFPMLGSSRPPTAYSPGYGGEDFAIESEDFPALPGAQAPQLSATSSQQGLMSKNGHDATLSHSHLGSVGGKNLGSVGGGSFQQSPQAPAPQAESSHGAFDSSISMGMGALLGAGLAQGNHSLAGTQEAKFGLAGLLDVIRLTDQDMQTLALGTDLTTFGLNLNAAESLFPTFSSPFTDTPLAPEPSFRTPSCYMMNPPTLKAEHLSKFQIETLFYMFYSMPRDILQACAAQELYRRDWRFNAELKVWFKPRSQNEQMQSHPNATFWYFDVAAWDTRPFSRGSVGAMLTEEEVRVKVPAPAPAS